MATYPIKWRRSDYAKLGHAVANFNREVIKAREGNKMSVNFLPALKQYGNIKNAITTRREFNRVVNSLERINKADALDFVYSKSGEEMTNWELQETRRQQKLYIRNLQKEIEDYPMREGVMGNERVEEIKAKLETVREWEMQKKYEYKKLMNEIQKRGTEDWEFKMQVTFKENYLKALEDYENQPFYEELIETIQGLNPADFYEVIKNNNLIDFLSADWYKLDRDKYAQLVNNLNVGKLENYEFLGKITLDYKNR